ncbi:hypothetical protein ACFVYC_09230 [Pseudarthrobacter sp. NPDC058329]
MLVRHRRLLPLPGATVLLLRPQDGLLYPARGKVWVSVKIHAAVLLHS